MTSPLRNTRPQVFKIAHRFMYSVSKAFTICTLNYQNSKHLKVVDPDILDRCYAISDRKEVYSAQMQNVMDYVQVRYSTVQYSTVQYSTVQ